MSAESRGLHRRRRRRIVKSGRRRRRAGSPFASQESTAERSRGEHSPGRTSRSAGQVIGKI